ncbi:hypothetical protein [Diplocloster hominis]
MSGLLYIFLDLVVDQMITDLDVTDDTIIRRYRQAVCQQSKIEGL